jgi:choline dehydrogenase-like flavoprotein
MRSYAASAYYTPNVGRSNFLVLTGVYATKVGTHSSVPDTFVSATLITLKIHFTKENGGLQRAVGVDIIKDDTVATVHVSREVILSAGTYPCPLIVVFAEALSTSGTLQTPQLLELSGIGNKKILHTIGIDSVIDLPGVGENLRTLFPGLVSSCHGTILVFQRTTCGHRQSQKSTAQSNRLRYSVIQRS